VASSDGRARPVSDDSDNPDMGGHVATPPDSDGCGYARRLPATRRPAAKKLLVPAEVLVFQAGLAFVILLHEALDAPVW
jgi:hypothetical protein